MSSADNQATENLQIFTKYASVLMPLLIEAGQNVDYPAVQAEAFDLRDEDADTGLGDQSDLVVGLASRLHDLYIFLRSQADKANAR